MAQNKFCGGPITHHGRIHERCSECGFEGAIWTDESARAELVRLPDRWAAAIDGLSAGDLVRRPRPDRWSIAEYTDHVRESLFGMRFLLDIAVADAGTNLGEPPTPRFDPKPRLVDTDAALAASGTEIELLVTRLDELDDELWTCAVTNEGDEVDAHWILRHALHDVIHHLADVAALRALQ